MKHGSTNIQQLIVEMLDGIAIPVKVDVSQSTLAFKIDYSNSKNAKEHYIEFIRECLRKFSKDRRTKSDQEIYALFCAIVQSSGYGKSRLVIESGKKDLNTIYCNLNSLNSGYPKSNASLLEFLRKINSVPELTLFLCLCYKRAYEIVFIEYENSELLPLNGQEGLQFSYDPFWKHVMNEFDNMARLAEDSRLKILQFFSGQQKTFSKYFQVDSLKYENDFHSSGRRNNGLVVCSNGDSFLSELVLVFDEAKSLIEVDNRGIPEYEDMSVFRNLRRAQKCLDSRNMILVFTDTLSSISNFAPAALMHPSFRPGTPAFTLLHPFYEILTYDVLAKKEIDPIRDLDDCLPLFSQGRPIWAALFNDVTTKGQEVVLDLVKFAKQKLVFESSGRLKIDEISTPSLDMLEETDYEVEDAAAIAVQAIRYGIEGVMDHSLASKLMSSYMGTGISLGSSSLLFTL